jgi:hypothetical protein
MSFEILGGWLLFVSFLDLSETLATWDYAVVGFLVTLLGSVNISNHKVKGWITAMLGLWLIASSFVPALITEPGVSINELIASVILIYFGYHYFDAGKKKTISMEM